ncbi:cytochrome ubiquinol oxidase subunit I, partial [Candidatus Saccharibacteria bacterium]|nr:cytochrome ubiquinol oxidase subunit I [Candidatus Saccharibacteria bacterium]
SIGFPFIMNILEYFAMRRDSKQLYKVVRLLSEWTTVLVVTGVISGTLIGMQFSILWGPFVAEARPYVGKFFMLEGYMFMLEAVFLAWYRITAGKVSAFRHWLIGLPITIGAMGSAVFITTVNAWMNNPSATFTSTTFFEITHSITGYLLASTLVVIGWLGWRLAKAQSKDRFAHRLVYSLVLLSIGLIAVIGVLGHQSAQNLAKTQPLKLAGMEILDKTQANAPLRVGGQINSAGEAEGGLVVPTALSVLAGNSPNHKVTGLDSAPRDKWPMLIIHTLFDIKMALVGALTTLLVITGFLYYRSKDKLLRDWNLKLLALFGLSGILIVELGWMVTELGRQPWAIYGKMLTEDAFTTNNSALSIGYLFPVMFVLLLGASVFALTMVTKAWRKREHITW